jgi:hypothetical protein
MQNANAQTFNIEKTEAIDSFIVCNLYSIGKTRESEIKLIDMLISKGKLEKSNYSASMEIVIQSDTFYVPISIKNSDAELLKELGGSSGRKIKAHCTVFPQLPANNRRYISILSPLIIVNRYEFVE